MAAVSAPDDATVIGRWRLLLGRAAEAHGLPLSGAAGEAADRLLEELFRPAELARARGSRSGRARKAKGRGSRSSGGEAGSERGEGTSESREGGTGPSTMTVPEWVSRVAELFPRSAKEVMERELVRRRGVAALLAEPKLLERLEPNVELVKLLLTHRSLLNERTRPVARRVIEQVIEELKRLLRVEVEPVLAGALRRDRHAPQPAFRNLDLKRTVWRNLQHFDAEQQRLLVDRLYFFATERRRRPWHVIVLVDQSGSMLESAIFSAVMASIFAELPAMRTSLAIFDTQVVDLSEKVGQPVDVLLSVQLGGGTDIAKAMRYAEQLVREPRRTIVVLISDFFEGGDPDRLVATTEALATAGVRLVGLAALSYECRPAYSHGMAKRLRRAGMDVMACTPLELARCIARIIRR